MTRTTWFRKFKDCVPSFAGAGNWAPSFRLQGPPYPLTPVGYMFQEAMKKAGLNPVMLANSLISPGEPRYQTKYAIGRALRASAGAWPNGQVPKFWCGSENDLWSDRTRDACNMCGYCGEFACWGRSAPKSVPGSRPSGSSRICPTPRSALIFWSMRSCTTAERGGRPASDISTFPTRPSQAGELYAHNVIVSCGAVQSARLLLMSGPPGGLGNRYDQVGRNACFHIFGMGSKGVLRKGFQGKVHPEFGHTGNVTAFDYYFVEDTRDSSEQKGMWCKGGTLASAAKKNPLENADILAIHQTRRSRRLRASICWMASNSMRGVLRCVLPETICRCLAIASISTQIMWMNTAYRWRVSRDSSASMRSGWPSCSSPGWMPCSSPMSEWILTKVKFGPGLIDLFGDHQLGTCRMGEDPASSVVDPYCRVHDVPNLFVVDSSFMPTGLGLNPMKTVVANALRVGTWIVEQSRSSGSEVSY